jgi:hypothetical protein
MLLFLLDDFAELWKPFNHVPLRSLQVMAQVHLIKFLKYLVEFVKSNHIRFLFQNQLPFEQVTRVLL